MPRKYMIAYPGDPISEVVEYTKDEFLSEFPRTGLTISTFDTLDQLLSGQCISSQHFPIAEILCDLCGDPHIEGEPVYVAYGTVGRCKKCFDEWFRPYIINQG